MAIRSLVNDAWEDVEDMRTYVDDAFESADHANDYIDDAWQEVWGSGYEISFVCISGSSTGGTIYGEENTGYYVANGNSAKVNPESDSYHSFSVCLCINDVNLTSGSHTLTFDATTKNTHHLNANAYDGTSLQTKTASVGTNSITFTIASSCTKLFWSIGYTGGDTISNVTLDGKKCKFV